MAGKTMQAVVHYALARGSVELREAPRPQEPAAYEISASRLPAFPNLAGR